ncbi:hypothetical protein [Nostocoides vanveenii]|uniref:Uncharacterized protein n=1 Tax=Nostocoides vanveenii TaxID=330835 RepID=A0ABN2KE89_9MICO
MPADPDLAGWLAAHPWTVTGAVLAATAGLLVLIALRAFGCLIRLAFITAVFAGGLALIRHLSPGITWKEIGAYIVGTGLLVALLDDATKPPPPRVTVWVRHRD